MYKFIINGHRFIKQNIVDYYPLDTYIGSRNVEYSYNIKINGVGLKTFVNKEERDGILELLDESINLEKDTIINY